MASTHELEERRNLLSAEKLAPPSRRVQKAVAEGTQSRRFTQLPRWSEDVLNRGLAAFYRAFAARGETIGPELPLPSPDVIVSSDDCIHHRIEEQARRSPDAAAVTCGADRLTYHQLNSRANRLARHLRGLGVGPEVLVAVCLRRSLDLVVALVAVLKAGGATFRSAPRTPRNGWRSCTPTAPPPSSSPSRTWCSALPAGRSRLLCLDADLLPDVAGSDADLPPLATADNLAYVIYTSGSTGLPKGVMVTRRNLARLFEATQPWFGFDSNDVWTSVPLQCVRLLGVGDVGGPGVWRAAGRGAAPHCPVAAGVLRAASQRACDGPEPDPLRLPSVDSRGGRRRRGGSAQPPAGDLRR